MNKMILASLTMLFVSISSWAQQTDVEYYSNFSYPKDFFAYQNFLIVQLSEYENDNETIQKYAKEKYQGKIIFLKEADLKKEEYKDLNQYRYIVRINKKAEYNNITCTLFTMTNRETGEQFVNSESVIYKVGISSYFKILQYKVDRDRQKDATKKATN